MKKSSRSQTTKLVYGFFLLLISVSAFADSDPNQLLSFKKIYVEPVQDNVDGAFKAPIEQSYKEIFERNPRFEMVSDAGQADSIVRTKIEKKTSGLDLDISLVALGTGEVFSADHQTIAVSSNGAETGKAVKALLKTALKRIPFYGTVTGRDGAELTFDIGAAHGLRKGDVVQISRVDNIKRHPLLKSIVDVQMVPVGTATVEQTEENIAFGKVESEIAGESIRRMYKVTAIESQASEGKKEVSKPTEGLAANASPAGDNVPDGVERPTIGYVNLGLFLGSFSSSSSKASTNTTADGSGFAPGFRLSAEVWLTKRWFADFLVAYNTISFSSKTKVGGAENPTKQESTSSTREIGFNAGYKYLPTNDIYGPQAYVKLGYYNFKFDTSISAPDLLSPKTYGGLNVGVGGQLPITSREWGALLNVNFLLFSSMSEDGFQTGQDPSKTVANFYVGGYHYFNSQLAVRAGLLFEVFSTSFGNSNDTSTAASTSQKSIGFLPSLLYYF